MSVKKGRTSRACETPVLKVGDRAPDFALPAHIGDADVRLSGFNGKQNVVLAFYPLDWTGV